MKRSEINKALKELEAMCEKYHCYLPPFCHVTPEEWENMGHEYDEVRDCMLGWDITDYGLGNFEKVGFSLITIRNGNRGMAEKYPKVYAEKLLYLKEGQYAPNHFHWYKTEDIINRGGGNVLIRVYNSLPDEEIDYESDDKIMASELFRIYSRWAKVNNEYEMSSKKFFSEADKKLPNKGRNGKGVFYSNIKLTDYAKELAQSGRQYSFDDFT